MSETIRKTVAPTGRALSLLGAFRRTTILSDLIIEQKLSRHAGSVIDEVISDEGIGIVEDRQWRGSGRHSAWASVRRPPPMGRRKLV